MSTDTSATGSNLVRVILALATIATAVSAVYEKCPIDSTPTPPVGICADPACQEIRAFTLAAWKQMQIIDQSLDNQLSTQHCQSLINMYRQIQTDKVDPLFVTHIYNSIDVYQNGLLLYKEIDAARTQIGQYNLEEQAKNQLWWQTYKEQFEQRDNQLVQSFNQLDAQDKDIGRSLSVKFDIPFPDGTSN